MIRMSSLRQLAKVWHKAAAANSAEEGAALKGILESGDFKIDLDERTASLCGHELQLTSEELDVLIFWPAIVNIWFHYKPLCRQIRPRIDASKLNS